MFLIESFFFRNSVNSLISICLSDLKDQQEGHDGPGSPNRVIFPTIEFYIFFPFVPTCDPQGGASFDSKGII